MGKTLTFNLEGLLVKKEHELTVLKCCVSGRLVVMGGRMGSRKRGYCDYPGKRLVMLGAKRVLLEMKRRVWILDIIWVSSRGSSK